MQIIRKKEKSSAFLDWIVSIDFDKVYITKVRIICHGLMWIILTVFIESNLLLNYRLDVATSLAFMVRSLICNMAIFYFFFYLVLPRSIMKNRVFFIILSVPFCLILWIVLNHYCLVLINSNLVINNENLKTQVNFFAHKNLKETVAFDNLFSQIIVVLYSISPFFFIKIVFDVVRYYSKWFKAEKKSNQLEIEKLNVERDFLKAQLNPHFLFNTLNNLYGMARRHDPMAPQTIAGLAEMMRYTLYQSKESYVSLAQELAFLKNYISLEKIRHEAGSHIACNINEEGVGSQVIAPLLTFVFVENAFKYGLRSKNEGFLKIKVSVIQNIFNFIVLNDKQSSSPPGRVGGAAGGIGIQNVKKRLENLYPGKHHLQIEDRGDSFYVEMEVNLNEENNFKGGTNHEQENYMPDRG